MITLRFPLNVLIPVFLLVGGLATNAFVTVLYARAEIQALRAAEERVTTTLGEVVAGELAYSLRSGRFANADRILDRLKFDRSLLGGIYVDDQGEIILSTDFSLKAKNWRDLPYRAIEAEATATRQDFLSRSVADADLLNVFGVFPVLLPPSEGEMASNRVGLLFVHRDLRPARERFLGIIYQQFAFVSLFVALMSLLSWLLLRAVLLQRMQQIVVALGQSESAEIVGPLPLQGRDELSRIARALQRLSRRIQESTEALRASEKRFRVTFEQAAVGIALVEPDSQFIDVNERLASILGYTPEELLGVRVEEISHPDDFPRHADHYSAALRGEMDSYILELRLLSRSKAVVWVTLSVALVRDVQDAPECFIAVVNDITERKVAGEKLRISEQRFRNFVAQASEGIFRVELDPPVSIEAPVEEQLRVYLGSEISECNDAMARMYGYERADEVMGRMAGSFFPVDDLSALTAAADEFAATYRTSNLILRQTGRSGVTLWVSANIAGVVENDMLVRVWGTQRDITRERMADLRVRESERRFRGIFDSTFQFIGLLSPDGKLLEANRRSMDFIDQDIKHVRGELFWETPWWTGDPVVQEQVRGMVEDAANGSFTRANMELRNGRGDHLYVNFTITPVRDEEDRVVLLIPEASDITEQTQVTLELRESEERLRNTFDNAAVGIAHVSPDGQWLRVNPRLCDMLGFTEAELLASTFQEITHPDDLDMDMDNVLSMLRGDITTYSMEKRYIHKDGGIVWIDLTVSLVRTKGGEPNYFISVIADITERREAEDALRRSQALLHQVVDSLEEAVLLVEPVSNRIVECNPAAASMFQREREVLVLLSTRSLHRNDSDFEVFLSRCEEVWKSGSGTTGSCELMRSDGEQFPVEFTVRSIAVGAETEELLVIVFRDMSERQRVEKLRYYSAFQAGIAETGTSVLHNIGNAITSVASDSQRLLQHVDDIKRIGGLLTASVEQSMAAPPDRENLERLWNVQQQASATLQQLHEEELRGRVKRIGSSVRHIAEIVRIQQSAAQPGEGQTTFDLDDLVSDAVAMHGNRLEAGGIQVVVDLDPALNRQTMSRNRLMQALINGIKNSYEAIEERQATEESEGKIVIESRRREHGGLRLTVCDNGIGLTRWQLENVFEFGETTKKNGSGYGLHATMLFVREQGGQVWMESDGTGKGACLIMEFPEHGKPDEPDNDGGGSDLG